MDSDQKHKMLDASATLAADSYLPCARTWTSGSGSGSVDCHTVRKDNLEQNLDLIDEAEPAPESGIESETARGRAEFETG